MVNKNDDENDPEGNGLSDYQRGMNYGCLLGFLLAIMVLASPMWWFLWRAGR